MRVMLFKQFNVNLDNCKTCASVEPVDEYLKRR